MGPRPSRASGRAQPGKEAVGSRLRIAGDVPGRKRGNTAMMRQDRFTEQAQEVLAASQQMVREYRHPQWDVEHIFLALLQHQDGLARQIFEKLNVPVDQLRNRVAAHLARSPKLGADQVQIYVTPRSVRLLEAANA